MGSDGTLKIKVLGDVADFQAKMKTVEGGLGSLAKTALPAVGLAAAAGFGLVAKGALEAQAAQGKFMAATGASREEAAKFVSGMDSLAGSAGAVGKSFEDIAATGTMVEQQFGTTGQKTTDLTENILEFAKVTSQDATQAAGDLEDTLSAFGLSADDATGFMDALIASNQKFGTDAGPAAVQALKDMAPALDAMGLGLEDGIGFLNAFEVAGGDANDAASALNKAIKALKPGQDINDLITQVGEIEDPLLKAQEATKLFGKAAGPGMALLIKPGMTSLEDFQVATDGAGDHLHDAAGNMLTDSDKIRGIFDKLTAGARELGQQFGPALAGLGGLTSLAAGFAGTLKDGLGLVLKSGPVQAAATALGAGIGALQAEAQALAATGTAAIQGMAARIGAMAIPLAPAGTTLGGAIGASIGLGIVTLGAVFIGAAIWQAFQDAMNNVKNHPDQLTDPDLFGSRAPMWAKARISAAQEMLAISQSALDAFNAEWDRGIAAGLSPEAALGPARQAGLAVGNTAGTAANQGFTETVSPSGWADAISSSGSWAAAGQAAATVTTDAFYAYWNDQKAGFESNGAHLTEWLAAGAASNDATHALGNAVDQLKAILDNELSPEEMGLQAIGKEWMETIARGMKDENPANVQTARELAIQSIHAIEEAGLKGAKGQKGLKDIGIYFDELVASGLTAKQALAMVTAGGRELPPAVIDGIEKKYPELVTTGGVMADKVHSGFTSRDWSGWGWNSAAGWISGFANKFDAFSWANLINSTIGPKFSGQSPPKEGPLHDIDKWGFNVGQAWAGGFELGLQPDLSGVLTPQAFHSAVVGVSGGSVARSPSIGDVTINIYDATDPEKVGDVVLRKLNDFVGAAMRGSHVRWDPA